MGAGNEAFNICLIRKNDNKKSFLEVIYMFMSTYL